WDLLRGSALSLHCSQSTHGGRSPRGPRRRSALTDPPLLCPCANVARAHGGFSAAFTSRAARGAVDSTRIAPARLLVEYSVVARNSRAIAAGAERIDSRARIQGRRDAPVADRGGVPSASRASRASVRRQLSRRAPHRAPVETSSLLGDASASAGVGRIRVRGLLNPFLNGVEPDRSC